MWLRGLRRIDEAARRARRRPADRAQPQLPGFGVSESVSDLPVLAAVDVTRLNHTPVQVPPQIDHCPGLAVNSALARSPP